MSKLWGGRFEGTLDPRFERFQKSLAFDARLVLEDLAGSRAWARALGRAAVLMPEEVSRILESLEDLAAEIERDPELFAASDAEDVHTFVETALAARIGDLAKKLHTGRSRNDQVATDLKLFLRTACGQIETRLRDLVRALIELGGPNAGVAMPGYTHLQRAQPVTVGHHLLAYVEMLARDLARIGDTRNRMNTCPLGSGALAGAALPIDREALARDLGFASSTRNSIDAVADRDHACEVAFTCALIQVHLSRLAEDWIFFASQEVAFLELSDAVATGSSLMPQKKNPDGLELLRGKTGRALGNLQALLVMLKGLPLAYDKDLQEDKEAVFDAVDTCVASLEVAAIVVRNARFQGERCSAEAARGYLNATDLADLLVAAGIPFRSAHERAGAAVRSALERGVELEELDIETRRRLLPELEGIDLARELSVEACLARRDVIGGTAPARVRAEIEHWKQRIESWSTRS